MKNDPLTKSDLAWLLIRAAGMLLAWIALTKVTWILYLIYLLTNEGWKEISDNIGSRLSWEMALPNALQFLLCAIVATYLLKGGRFIHGVLVSIPAKVSLNKDEQDGAE
jgi:hypothetical protein